MAHTTKNEILRISCTRLPTLNLEVSKDVKLLLLNLFRNTKIMQRKLQQDNQTRSPNISLEMSNVKSKRTQLEIPKTTSMLVHIKEQGWGIYNDLHINRSRYCSMPTERWGMKFGPFTLKQSFGRIQYLHILVDEKSSESTNKHVNLKDKNVFP